MSGINVSNPRTSTNPFDNLDQPDLNGQDVKTKALKSNADLAWLDDLSKVDTSAFRIVEKGEGENKKQYFYGGDRGMTFRSGLNRVFGQGKSDEDKAANTASLKAVMDYIKRETNEGTYEALLNQKIKLAGDSTAKTIQERMDSGTYVSSKLVAELKVLAVRENRQQYVDQTTTQITDMAFRDGNRRTMNAFLGRGTDEGSTIVEDLKGLHLTDAMKGIGAEIQANVAKLFGKSDETLSETIKALVEVGVPGEGNGDYSAEKYPDVWKKIGEFYTPTGDEAKDKQRLERLERHLKVECDQFAKQGKPVSMADLVGFTKNFLTRPEIFAQFVDMTNHELVHEMKVDQVFEAIRKWPEAHNRPDLQNAADWLANQLKENFDAEKTKPLQHVIPKTLDDGSILGKIDEFIDRNVVDTLKGWADKGWGNAYDEATDPGVVFEKVTDAILNNFKEDAPPLDLSDSERFTWLRERFPDDMEAYKRGRFPQQYTTTDFGRLIGNSIESLLVEHKTMMDDLNAEELSFFGGRRTELEENTPPQQLKYVHHNINHTKPEEFAKLGWPTNAEDFVKAKLMPVLVNAEMNLAIKGMKEEYGEDALDDKVLQQRTVDEAKQNVGTHDMHTLLPSLDEYRDFCKEVDELRQRPDGLAGLDRETLDRLDTTSKKLLDHGVQMFEIGKQFIEEYGAEYIDDTTMDRLGWTDDEKESFKEQQKTRQDVFGVTPEFSEKFGAKAREMGGVLGRTGVDIQAYTMEFRHTTGSVLRERENAEKLEQAFDTEIQNVDAVLKDLEQLEKDVERDLMKSVVDGTYEQKLQEQRSDPTLSWVKKDSPLAKQLDAYPSIQELAGKARHPQLLANYDSISGLIEGVVHAGAKIELQSEFSVKEMYLTPQDAIDAQNEADKKWDNDFRSSLKALDRFAEFRAKVASHGDMEGLKTLDEATRNELRAELEKMQPDINELNLKINQLGTRFVDSKFIPVDDVTQALSTATEQIYVGSQKLLEALGSTPPPTWQYPDFQQSVDVYPSLGELASRSTGKDTITGIMRDLVIEPEMDRLTAKYANDQETMARRHGETLNAWKGFETQLKVLDQYADVRHNVDAMGADGLSRLRPGERDQLRRDMKRASDNASDLGKTLSGVWETFSREMSRDQRTDFDRINVAFRDAGQKVVNDTKHVLEMLDQADGIVPNHAWEKPSFQQSVDLYPSLRGFADQVGEKNSITDIAKDLALGREEQRLGTKYANDQVTRDRRLKETEGNWASIERDLEVLDRFAELQHNVSKMGLAGLRDESPRVRDRLRQDAEECFTNAQRINDATDKIKKDFDPSLTGSTTINRLNMALNDASETVVTGSRSIVLMLRELQ